MVIAVTRAWKKKYEELVEERADLELKLKTVQVWAELKLVS